jgi:hypothetical protein
LSELDPHQDRAWVIARRCEQNKRAPPVVEPFRMLPIASASDGVLTGTSTTMAVTKTCLLWVK